MLYIILSNILSILTSFSMVYALVYTLSFQISPLFLLLIITVITALYNVIFYNRYTILFSSILVLVTFFVRFIFFASRGIISDAVNKMQVIFYWFLDYVNGYENLNNDYAFWIALVITAAIALLVYIFTVKCFNFYTILSGGILIFVMQSMLNYLISCTSFYMFLALMLLYYFKHIYIRNSLREKNDYITNSSFIILSIPLAAIIFLTAFFLPKSNKPIEWEWLDQKINTWFEFYNDKFHFTSYDYFSISSTGFGKDNERLGGKVALDKTPVMEVETVNRTYLRGAIRDVYTGTSWANSQDLFTQHMLDDNSHVHELNIDFNDDGTMKEYQCDIIEPFIGITLFRDDNNYDDSLIKKNNMKIRYLNLKTKTIFTPSKTTKYSPLKRKHRSISLDAEGMYSSEKKLGKGFEYNLEGYYVDYKNEKFIELLKNSYQGLYRNILSQRNIEDFLLNNMLSLYEDGIRMPDNQYASISEKEITALLQMSEGIYSKYLKLPDTLPDRIKSLALSITEDFDNSYEKVKAIEKYLNVSYPYTLKPSPTPNERDFTDYFLFDLKEGYCVYYATAMTVMLRSIGIPARYVEGYMLPPEEVSKTDTNQPAKLYRITNENAHAWVEVYFEGFGWIPFEPTPPFVSSFYSRDQSAGSYSSSFMEDPLYDEYMRMLNEYDSMIFKDMDIPAFNGEGNIKPDYTSKDILILFAAIIIFVLILVIFLNYFRRKIYISSIKQMDHKNCVINITNYYIKIFTSMGFDIQRGETLIEYIKRVEEQLAYEKYSYHNETLMDFRQRVVNIDTLSKHSGLKTVVEIFLAARYSKQQIVENQKNLALEYYPKIIAEAKGNLGYFKYFVYRYLIGKF